MTSDLFIGKLTTNNQIRFMLFDKKVLRQVFENARFSDIKDALWMNQKVNSFITDLIEKALIAQITVLKTMDGTGWRVCSVSSSQRGFGTKMYYLAMNALYPSGLCSDQRLSDVDEVPRRIWEKIACDPKVRSAPRTNPEEFESFPVLKCQYFCVGKPEFPIVDLSEEWDSFEFFEPLWQITNNASGSISRFFNFLGFQHFCRLCTY